MARILVHVEGQTEELFVQELLSPHLGRFGHTVAARLMGRPRERARRGGVVGWSRAKADLLAKLRGEPDLHVTTMVDYYGMPLSGEGAWPGRAEARGTSLRRASIVQDGMAQDVANEMGASFDRRRFVPYVAMHEFEALLFSDPKAFASGLYAPGLEVPFRGILEQCGEPEAINDSPHGAPSKRIAALMPSYEKPLFGNAAALQVGLEAMRRCCPNFAAWVVALERSA